MAKSALWHVERLGLEPTAPAPKRKYTPQSPESRMQTRIASEVGYDIRVLERQKRGLGRPKGSKNKPKPQGYIAEKQIRGPRITDTLSIRNVEKHFCLINGVIWHKTAAGLIDRPARVKPKGPKQGEWQAWHVRYGGNVYLAVEVAFWLLHKRDPRPGYRAYCEDITTYPRYTEDVVTEVKLSDKPDGSRV